MKKRGIRFSHVYLTVVMVITYLPILMVVLFSFNDSSVPVAWKG